MENQSQHGFELLVSVPEMDESGLTLESTLGELSQHKIQLDISARGVELVNVFDDPVVPGVILLEHGSYAGMVSRRRFLEVMNQPYSKDLFTRRPVKSLVKYLSVGEDKSWPADTSIVKAVATCLRQRPPQLRSEPLVVVTGNEYQVLDFHQLLIAHARIHELATRMLEHQVEVLEYAMSLENKNAELERLNQLKDEFLANTSHELRTPLNGIIGIADSLVDGALGPLNDTQYKNLNMIRQSGRRLASLVNDILDFSKLRNNKIELQHQPLNLCHNVDNVLQLSMTLISNKDVQLRNEIPAHFPAAWADDHRVQQILHNLVGNAVKFTEHGSVTVSAQTLTAMPNERQAAPHGWLEISVTDTGIGIPEEKQARIFEAFEQADGSTERKYGGTGLGLSITRQLVALHGGKMSVRSTPGVGSVFSFTLPVADADAEAEVIANTEVAQINQECVVNVASSELVIPISTSQGSAGTILVVDDEPVNLQVLLNHLASQNYTITLALSGQEALQYIEDGLEPDLVLLDIMMPGMNGYEVTRRIRKDHPADELPILLLTAKNQTSDLVEGFDAGANDYLTKPVSKDELLARLSTHLKIKRLKSDNLRMKSELDVTRRLQQMLLPRDTEMHHPSLDLAGFMEPSDEVGGDYYDVLAHSCGRLKIGIGDVTGHGLESGVVAIMVQTAVRALLSNQEKDPVKFMNSLNDTIYRNVQRMNSDKNLTLSLLDYDAGNICVTGQHEEVIVIRANGDIERIDTFDLGFFIGMTDNIADYIGHMQVNLQPGDGLVLYTDGITEAQDKKGNQYGVDRLCQILLENWHMNAVSIRESVIKDVRKHIGKKKAADDLTLVVMKEKPALAPKTLLAAQQIPSILVPKMVN